jgi:L-asparaginase II
MTRGSIVETRHEVVVSAVDEMGDIIVAQGDGSLITPVRSTVKLLQALSLVRTGAADAFSVSDTELALACGSHSGELIHRRAVETWLNRIGCSGTSLQCGESLPRPTSIAEGSTPPEIQPGRLAHNCSGKHAAFLTVVRHLGDDPAMYLLRDSRLQKLVLEAVAETCGLRPTSITVEIDGCGAPVTCLEIGVLARGIARVLTAGPQSAEARLLDAVTRFPQMVAGPGRIDTLVPQVTGGRVLTKEGAGGIHIAYVRSLGVGVAVKALDGNPLAAEMALLHTVADLDDGKLWDQLGPLTERPIVNDQGRPVGVMRISRRPRAY